MQPEGGHQDEAQQHEASEGEQTVLCGRQLTVRIRRLKVARKADETCTVIAATSQEKNETTRSTLGSRCLSS